MAVSRNKLFSTLEKNKLDSLKGMLEKDTVNMLNGDGWSLLHLAVDQSNSAAVDLLITMGSQVDIPDPEGNTPLHFAVTRMNYDICQRLLEAGADPNLKGKRGMTPLRWAVATPFDDYSLVQLLLSHGGDPTIANDDGVSTIEYAESVYPDLAKQMRSKRRKKH